MKLFTIGDSISQGFMSLAAARTDLSYATLLAEKLGLQRQIDYRFADWDAGGIPLNVETVMRRLNRRYGTNIRGLEWLTVLQTINDVVDQAEDYYERGAGRPALPYGDGTVEFFHNVAIRGFDIADAWQVTPALCREALQLANGPRPSDGYLTGPENPYYRTALKVLNPALKPAYEHFSQLSWLEKHATEGGIDTLVLWLGANNALGTVITLKINQTPNNPHQRPFQIPHLERVKVRKWNLWHPEDFQADFAELLRRVDAIMQQNAAANWRVCIGTIPLVTIAPLAKGVGATTDVPDKGVYYKYYTYFPFEEDFARETGIHLTMQDALHIDGCIRQYNEIIKASVAHCNTQHGSPQRYYIVDICQALQELAFKRNNGQPTYKFPDYFQFVYPKVNTKYYHVDTEGQLKQGGFFSLDGIHPTAIGHGLIAYEFLKVMHQAGIVADTRLDWQTIFTNDTLYTQPITLMHELYGYGDLAKHLIKLVQLFGI